MIKFLNPLVTTSLEFAGLKFQLGVPDDVEKNKGANLRSCKRTYKLPNGEPVTNCTQLKLLAADGKSAWAEFSAVVAFAESNFRLGVLNYLNLKPVWKKVTWRKFALCEMMTPVILRDRNPEPCGRNFALTSRTIRNMKPTWEKITGRKFALCEIYRRNSRILGQKTGNLDIPDCRKRV